MSQLQILTAQPRNGKTQAALDQVGKGRAVWFVPTPENNNQDLTAIPYQFLSEVPAHLVVPLCKRHPQVRLVILDDEADRLEEFMVPEFSGTTFVFDDMPQLFYSGKAKTAFVRFAAGFRHRNINITITTQQVSGILPTFSRAVADSIIQVGPLLSQEESETLYRMGGSFRYRTQAAFYAAVSANPRYNQFVVK